MVILLRTAWIGWGKQDHRRNAGNAGVEILKTFRALRDRGLADETLVVITGDHGGAFRNPHDQHGTAPRLIRRTGEEKNEEKGSAI